MSNSRSVLGCIALLTMVSATFEVGSAQTAVGYQRCRMFCGISEPVRRQCCWQYRICCLGSDSLGGLGGLGGIVGSIGFFPTTYQQGYDARTTEGELDPRVAPFKR
ncbi:hypothetical protein IscW_ISCW011629 [Ixodes scapularis]|uniref:Uncharacterized protein n=1 Tax=Ixodes scapularis TaxID=6945 RepID=B7Q7I7_IXOSC|nr:hypothetical protein IscW_ISCW011629 [Ixodes scapularis]|eukprot:XP_002412171.1 hypothetical protein IscW_ISCW011629 [Ixodes scapularis]